MNPHYNIIRAPNTTALVTAVDQALPLGVWECSGGPFWDASMREWCQALVRVRPPQQPGEVSLREPKRRAL